MADSVSVLVRGVPPELKQAIVAAVQADGGNMNDHVVKILANRFEIKFTPTGRPPGARLGEAPDVVLRMPSRLRVRIKVAAARSGSNVRDTIVAVLSEHYGTRFAPAPRRPRTPAAA